MGSKNTDSSSGGRTDDADDPRTAPRTDAEATTDTDRELLHLVTQKTRFTLLQNVVAHPEGMPSLRELDYVNPGKSKSTIRNHLAELIDHGVCETVQLPREQRSRDLPWKFFRLTDDGRRFLEDHGLLAADETLREMHSLLEKTDTIERYERAPRPDVDSSEVEE